MYVKRHYSFWQTLYWSIKPFLVGFIYASIICVLHYVMHFTVSMPWQPLSVLGVAVAFYLGFKNNSSYDRTWEARKIWGSIGSNSRSFGVGVNSFVQGENQDVIKKELIYRHIAWLTALRRQLRLAEEWEHKNDRLNEMFNPNICSEYNQTLRTELLEYLKEEEVETYIGKANVATQILNTQSNRLQELKDQDYFEDFRHMELYNVLKTFFNDQGKSERIKTFPFPRQYASTALWVTFVFAIFVPFGMIDILGDLKGWVIIINPFISALITWTFFLMEQIGDYSENPFEGSYNDVPITSISRTIEIDLREMIKDTNIPEPLEPINGFLL